MFLDALVVAIYKRAQILVADIWACCGGRGIGTFKDIDMLTAFADYRIPQALVWFGVLQYSDHLTQLLWAGTFVQDQVIIIINYNFCKCHCLMHGWNVKTKLYVIRKSQSRKTA